MSQHVIISLASNRNQKSNLAKARAYLEKILYGVTFTSEMWTEPYGEHTGSLYLNQLALGVFDGTLTELVTLLKQKETDMGRTDVDRYMGIVEIDLDILRFGLQRLHLTDWDRPYVKQLISEIDNFITHR
jgi:2-amino-4-hydroxy-6-hydroxymethyldihydropteridine diphosphokinase